MSFVMRELRLLAAPSEPCEHKRVHWAVWLSEVSERYSMQCSPYTLMAFYMLGKCSTTMCVYNIIYTYIYAYDMYIHTYIDYIYTYIHELLGLALTIFSI